MNNQDEFEQQLKAQADELNKLMADDTGLSGYLKQGLSSKLGWVMTFAYVLAIVLTLAIFGAGYKFFTVGAEQQLFWGVLLILVFNAQVAVKSWIFLETGRNHTAKEIRRMELRLVQRLQHSD
ncbi:hypothetical protein PSI9734_00846 [Pseudidiomarina piscicola]|uniref:Uncharacterized protein n=1 Tax=Pseudidiomarina piscicola TaxID=2614830 RepID=A0A6S6WTW3_9GAMM|nr:DUF6768 family protein [Pseudidiomarina piscicola]CAB0150293.1 hypothetical protein PSI9734_00846 [Pseudidiomarina piscicola]VZT39721.1 hypothetical protein PSI9734_00846 [Pseudomonas aeruginosa]